MKLYKLEPEVAGGLGEHTIFGTNEEVEEGGLSAKIRFLHYEFDGWLGDNLLETTPCFIVTKQLGMELRKSELTGYKLEECLVSVSEEFQDFHPNLVIPEFERFIPFGYVSLFDNTYQDWSGDSFCLTEKGYLVVTEAGLSVLKKLQLNNCDIEVLEQR